MIYYARNYIIHTHYAYIVRADVIECADASDYTCMLLHVQHPSPFERNKTKQQKQERKKYIQSKITVIMKHSVNVNVHLTGLRECTMFIT